MAEDGNCVGAAVRRTQVGIIGAGPAGLLLGQLLHTHGIDSVVLETRDRGYIESRQRAGVLESISVDALDECGAGARMHREGSAHDGTLFRAEGVTLRIDLKALTGKTMMVYSQTEVVRDLVAARLACGAPLVFGAEAMALEALDTARPVIRYRKDGTEHVLACDFVAGCDGFHGIARAAIPEGVKRVWERVYPFAWLGILCEAPVSLDELMYANSARGFALVSTRSASVQRMYVQCEPDEDLAGWPDERIWAELQARTATEAGDFRLIEGRITQKSVTGMRSFVCGPMRHGALFLAGDAAHIVPPTGAKGLNLATADVKRLAMSFDLFYRNGDASKLESYSDKALERVWKAQRFSWYMTSMMHNFPNATQFERQMQLAELDLLRRSENAARLLAEQYVGLPLDF